MKGRVGIFLAAALAFVGVTLAQVPGQSLFYLGGEDPWWRPLNPQGQSYGVTVGSTRPTTPANGELFLDMDGDADSGPVLEVYDGVNAEWNTYNDNDTASVAIGTANTVVKFNSAADDLADSNITDDATTITLAGTTVAFTNTTTNFTNTTVDFVTAGLVLTTGGVLTPDANFVIESGLTHINGDGSATDDAIVLGASTTADAQIYFDGAQALVFDTDATSGNDVSFLVNGTANTFFQVRANTAGNEFQFVPINAAGSSQDIFEITLTNVNELSNDTIVMLAFDMNDVEFDTASGSTFNFMNIEAFTPDSDVDYNGINITAITGDSGVESGINFGGGWDYELYFEGATDDAFDAALSVEDPTVGIATFRLPDRALAADIYDILATSDGTRTTGDLFYGEYTDAVAAAGNADDVMIVRRVFVPHPITVITVDVLNIDIANASATDNTIAVGIYADSDTGAQIVEVVGATDDGAGNATGLYSMNIADTTLQPGWYRIGFCPQDASDNDIEVHQVQADILLLYGAGTGEITGTAGNPCVNGDPPATTGAITNAADQPPFVLVTN